MSGISVLTLVRNREAHLHQLIEGLRRSARQPDELVIVDMSDTPAAIPSCPFPVVVDRFETQGLPLAAARNRAAARARQDQLVFLDVDCIPMSDCLGGLGSLLETIDGLLCADVLYLGPDDARGAWTEAELRLRGKPHPVRRFPSHGYRVEQNAGLFWSLAFAIRRDRYAALGGFDADFVGYGGEDTDFGYRAAAQGTPLIFVGGATACHQHHASHEPPVQHVRDIVRNATRFHARWGRWPMEGWLEALDDLGLVAWRRDALVFLRSPTAEELAETRTI
ncbi:glycosyltransferase family 2 protein [Sphingomonas sanxanigenens]|uniref:glycosyltransferase family 2 protein n=1 Tax=Sphingomonas sanxanigenens TaxID=397260 RepID=UPI00046D6F72|nr:glycosyltransferase [Sphingomonas sanxanigenens]